MVLKELAEVTAEALKKQALVLSIAESCTGGWIAKVVTDIPGSSAWFDRGFVTYSNRAKQELLAVKSETLHTFGAVSEQTVREMAKGALSSSGAQVSLAVTGVAGPAGGSIEKPVGTVCFAWCVQGRDTLSNIQLFNGDREQIRRQAVSHALEGLLVVLNAME